MSKKNREVLDEMPEAKPEDGALLLRPDFIIDADVEDAPQRELQEDVYFEESKQYLRCDFTDEELLGLSRKLARQISEQAGAERELKEVSTQLKANVTAKETAVQFTAGLVQNGYEYRTIDCQIFFDCPVTGKKQMLRNDTGEIVWTERMTGDDLQGQLFRKQKGKPSQDGQ